MSPFEEMFGRAEALTLHTDLGERSHYIRQLPYGVLRPFEAHGATAANLSRPGLRMGRGLF